MKSRNKLVVSDGCGRAELISKNYSFYYSLFEKTLFWFNKKTVVTFNGDGTKVILKQKNTSNNEKWIITTK